MNISYQWLRALAPDLEQTPDDLVEALALRGAPVESTEDLSGELKDVVIARVVEAGQHPNADRLSLCRVDAGGPELLSVVCGAPNVKAGAYYAFAPAGSTLPGGLKLKRSKIRGEVSEGMLCSPSELGLGADHSGILEVPKQPIGASFAASYGLDDTRLDVEVTANRGDLLSHRGVARELVGEHALRHPPIPGAQRPECRFVEGSAEVATSDFTVSIEAPEACWRFLGAVIRGVQVGPSPDWLQTRLGAAGARPINNVVDATNYVMLELGQPMHAYDLHKLGGGRINVRAARSGEKLTTLDGVVREVDAGMLLICDGEGPVGVAGVMGGLDSEVSEETEDVFLECALFEPGQVRSTRRALDLSTDASYRYERGVDPGMMQEAFLRALEVITATGGGRVEAEALDVRPRPWRPAELDLRPARIKQVLGLDFSDAELIALLSPLGFEVTGGTPLRVRVPGHRSYDVTREIDLVEEVARTHGYDRFPSHLAPFRPSSVPDHPLFDLEDRLRRLLVGEGLFEIQTMSLTPSGEVPVSKPLSSEGTHLRSDLLPGVCRVLEHNYRRSQRDLRFFELGTVFHAGEPGQRPHETTRLAVALTGGRSPSHWSDGSSDFDLWDLKALLARVLAKLGPSFLIRPAKTPGDRRGGCDVLWEAWEGERRLGYGGRVHPDALDAPPWAADVWAFELDLPGQGTAKPALSIETAPSFPAVDRDFSLVLPLGLSVAEVTRSVHEAAGRRLDSITVVDEYRGEGIPEGTRSVSLRLRFQAEDRTLTDKEVDRATKKVLKALKEGYDVEPRG